MKYFTESPYDKSVSEDTDKKSETKDKENNNPIKLSKMSVKK